MTSQKKSDGILLGINKVKYFHTFRGSPKARIKNNYTNFHTHNLNYAMLYEFVFNKYNIPISDDYSIN